MPGLNPDEITNWLPTEKSPWFLYFPVSAKIVSCK